MSEKKIQPIRPHDYFLGEGFCHSEDSDDILMFIFETHVMGDPHMQTLVSRYLHGIHPLKLIDKKIALKNFLYSTTSHYVLNGLEGSHPALKFMVLSSLVDLDWNKAVKFCIENFSPDSERN